MDKVLAIITLLVEAIIVLQCIQIVFKQRIKVDKYTVGHILTYIVIYMSINLDIIPFISVIVVYIFIGVFCYIKFRKSIVETLVRFVVSSALIAGLESISIILTCFFIKTDKSRVVLVISSIIGLALACLIRLIYYVWDKYIKGNKIIWKLGIILFYGFQIVGFFLEYHYSKSTIKIYVLILSTFLICIFLYVKRLDQAQNEITRKNYELEMQKIYGETYEQLLLEVRKRQHDYKNQLAAIYGMHLTAQTLDELIAMQKTYGNELREDNKFDSVLTLCNNPILAGFLYYRCVACENDGITVDYNIHIEQAECCFALHEIIEILGILVDNACECVKADTSLEPCIRLEFMEDEEKITFAVSNPARYIAFSEIDKMFISGYSSKGENRGIGLTRVRELVNKYEAEINVSNSNPCDKENWICFSIEIGK